MAGKPVAGDLYWKLDGQLWEIKRQLRQSGGYPFDPAALKRHLHAAIEGKFAGAGSTILHIDRSTPFNPAKFIGSGWSVWKGPVDGDGLSGPEDQDECSLALTELDLAHVRFETCLKEGEPSITGEEKQRRLKEEDFIRLDAQVFQYLWNHKNEIPESWKERVNRYTRYIFFNGTILRSPHGGRHVLYFYWRDGGWYWSCHWLDLDWLVDGPSAVLAKAV